MYFLLEEDGLLGKYNTIWDKVSTDTNKEFVSKPVYNKKSLKTEINSSVRKLQISTLKKFLKWTLIMLLLAVISLDSALNKDRNYYPKVFLKECKYIEKEKEKSD